jgi:hypothetical protein
MLFGEITCGDDAGLRTEPALPRKGTMDANHSLIAELEDAIESGSKDKRIDTLRRITDLFVADPIGLYQLSLIRTRAPNGANRWT